MTIEYMIQFLIGLGYNALNLIGLYGAALKVLIERVLEQL